LIEIFYRGNLTARSTLQPNFPLGSKYGKACSSQKSSLKNDSGVLFSPGAISNRF